MPKFLVTLIRECTDVEEATVEVEALTVEGAGLAALMVDEKELDWGNPEPIDTGEASVHNIRRLDK